jgi:hypothetical protein
MLSPVIIDIDIIDIINIQPVWLINEYVRIFRIDVLMRPPIPPTIFDARIILNITWLISIRYDINIMGAAF